MSQTFYRFTRPDGTTVLVSDPSAVPGDLRNEAEAIEVEFVGEGAQREALEEVRKSIEHVKEQIPFPVSGLALILVGAIGLIGVALASVSSGKPSWLTRAFLLTAGGALIASMYFGWIQREAGLSQDLTGSPHKILERAQEVADQAKARNDEVLRSLNELRKTREKQRRSSEEDQD